MQILDHRTGNVTACVSVILAGKMATFSFVSSIVQKSLTSSSDQLEKAIEDVSIKAKETESKVYKLIQQNYHDYTAFQSYVTGLASQIGSLQEEFGKLSHQIETETMTKAVESSTKKDAIKKKIRETEELIHKLSTLDDICTKLELFHSLLSAEDTVKAVDCLQVAQSGLDSIKKDIPNARIVKVLEKELTECSANLIGNLTSRFNSVFMTTSSVGGSAGGPSLSVTRQPDTTLFDSLKKVNLVHREAESLGSFVNSNFIGPILTQEVLKNVEAMVESSEKLTLNLVESAVPTPNRRVRVLAQINSLIILLSKINEAIPANHSTDWMKEMGVVICPFLTEKMKEELSRSLPSSQEEIQKYLKLVPTVRQLESHLQKLGLTDKTYTELSQFVLEADRHLALRQVKEVLAVGRDLLTKPLLTTERDQLKKYNPLESGANGETNIQVSFPDCLVSVSVKKFVELLFSLDNGTLTKQQVEVTVRRLIHLFLSVMPSYHQRITAQNTRAAIIFHNNCMYLVDQLAFSSIKRKALLSIQNIIDLIPVLRQLGEKVFLEAMLKEKRCILEGLNKCRDLQMCTSEEQQTLISKCLQEGIQYVKDFHDLSKDVFPDVLQSRCLCSLLDVVLAWLVGGIFELEDIGAEEADILYNFTSFVVNQGMKATHLPNNVLEIQCSHWKKISDLSFILLANLQQITLQWKEKKFLAITSEEIRGLIRSLFQNTDKRANALANIK